ncbi:leucine-rich repeat-containing protein 9-like isoform X3 [Bolinopsis microptera]|uniref:leucine-rich repeat-containing protein 9-like isoform X3 n=1 Tax=Bolinopsis microptera TaxID=2820187 RepID=UPI00307AF92C
MSIEDNQQVSSDSENEEENRALQPPSQEEEVIIRDLCIRNGLSSDKIIKGMMKRSVPRLENFFSGHCQMIRYNFFPGLRELEIMSLPLDRVQGLSACVSLEKLWICECKIRTLEGLEKCKSLRKLYLYSNQIQKIQGISNLYNLNTLWLNNNLIREIEGISKLVSLTDLNLASNKITEIGSSLKGHPNLESLNLSGNMLSSFKDLTNLVELSKLRFVGLKDPLYQSNPVCSLCNYSTHLLYHLPFLSHLDTIDISNGHLQKLAEATVQKKKMYYTMRVKMLQRNRAEMEARLCEERNKLAALPYERVHVMNCCIGDINRSRNDRENSQFPIQNRENSEQEHGQIVDKLLALEARVEHWIREISKVDLWHHNAKRYIEKEVEGTISKLMLELECGGNVRLEEGQVGDVWYNSCAELVQSRFCSADFKNLGITGIKINRIFRIHNRILRAQFEEKLDELLERESPADLAKYGLSDARIVTWKSVPYKRMLEYLFYIHNPNIAESVGSLNHILERGFRNVEHYLDAGSDGCISLSNSLSLAEAPRIKYLKKQRERGDHEDSADPCIVRHGQILICKTYIGNSEAAKESHCPLTKSSYPDCDSVYKTKDALPRSFSLGSGACDCSSRQCIWYVFMKELVTPEYLVDYEYVTNPRSSPLCGSVSICYNNGKEEVSIVQSSDNMQEELWCREVKTDEQVLDMPPTFEKIRESNLLIGGIEKLSSAKHFQTVTQINLHNQGLRSVKQLSAHPTLKKLVLSFNQLEGLEDFHHMDSLEDLDISFNGLTTLEGLRSLTNLKTLNISWNLLTISREEVHTMRKHTPSLQTLDMRHNPWIKNDGLRVRVIGRLKGLTVLDGEMVREEELTQAAHLASMSRISVGTLQTCCKTAQAPPRTLDLKSTAQCLSYKLSLKPESNELDPLWWSKVTSLCLDDQHICKLSNLDKLENLKWASFENNEIAKIEGLDSCTKLEELSLAGNCISKVEGLARLTKLQVLHLSNNIIVSLEGAGLEKLTKLWHVSLENNNLQNLTGLQIPSLIEVYVGNNCIQSSHDVFMLKSLPSLLILDMYGNPIVDNMSAYRSFVIYHLKSLRALDGSAIESSEVATAKENYGGRLCEDFIAEHLGHSNFLEVREIDFPNLSIRVIDLGNGARFKHLRSINLEGNALTSFGGLIQLENVKVLCLNHNNIETLSGKPPGGKGRDPPPPQLDTVPVMPKLEVLHLGYNGISNLTLLQLYRLPNLKSLFLQGNDIVNVEGLNQVKELRELVLDRNKIKCLSETSFCDQWNLLELHIEENRLKSLSNFHPLQKLQRLYLGMNRIQDLAELEKLECLPALKEISLTNNPVARRLMHRPLLVFRQPNLLSIDGIPISAEERAKADMYFLDYQPVEQTTSSNLPGISNKLHGVAHSGLVSQVPNQSNPIRGATNLPLGANQTWYGNYRESDSAIDTKKTDSNKKATRERNFYLDPQNSSSYSRQLPTLDASALRTSPTAVRNRGMVNVRLSTRSLARDLGLFSETNKWKTDRSAFSS